MNRTTAREYLMQIIYQMELQNDYDSGNIEKFFVMNSEEIDSESLSYIKAVIESISANQKEIDACIEENSKGWKINRIGKVDLAVLRLSIAEFKYLPEQSRVPVGASINEAVRIAKKYGTEDSGKFVNGILGSVSRK